MALLVAVLSETNAQISDLNNYPVKKYSNLLFEDLKFSNTGLILYNPSTMSYNKYSTNNRNVFAEIKPMYQVRLDFKNQADSFNPYNVKDPFESIVLGVTNMLFKKIQNRD